MVQSRLDIVGNSEILADPIKHFIVVLFDRTAAYLKPEYSIYIVRVVMDYASSICNVFCATLTNAIITLNSFPTCALIGVPGYFCNHLFLPTVQV